MMHGQRIIKICNAEEAKRIYHYKNMKKNCIRIMQPSGTTRFVDKKR
jgi:hypothetical protein